MKRIHPTHFECLFCGASQKVRRHMQKYCNASCQLKYEYTNKTRDKSTIAFKAQEAKREETLKKWNEGKPTKYVGKRGYVCVYTPSKVMYEHHLVWSSENSGCQVPKGFVVHHKNCIKTDNRIENLILLPSDYHNALHYAMMQKNEKGQLMSEV